jgi:hypothetical protein
MADFTDTDNDVYLRYKRFNALVDEMFVRQTELNDRKVQNAITDLRREFVMSVVEYAGGCDTSKYDFLVECGLEDYLPSRKFQVSFEVRVPFNQAGEDEIWSEVDNIGYAICSNVMYIDITDVGFDY